LILFLVKFDFTLERFGGTEGQVTGCWGKNCSRPIRSNAHRHRTRSPHN